MTIDELKRAARDDNPAALDTLEATARIESLTYQEVEGLNRDRDWVNQVTALIQRLYKELKATFVERDELIRIALASFLVQVPMIALGPPGTAKSAVLREIASRLGLRTSSASIAQVNSEMSALMRREKGSDRTDGTTSPQRRYFEYLVTRYTTADEILGPPHLDLMMNHALFYRQTAGLLPEAHVAFLDEVFKANSAILNALLSIMNERIFYNAGRAVGIPLCMVFGASNEPPPDQDLSALYDRFPIRVYCGYVTDEKETLRDTMIRTREGKVGQVFGAERKSQLASVNHFRLLFRLILVRQSNWSGTEAIEFSNSFLDTVRVFRREFHISDRSLERFDSLAHGLAVVRGNQYPGTSELEVFKYCFQDMESAHALADAVDDRINRR